MGKGGGGRSCERPWSYLGGGEDGEVRRELLAEHHIHVDEREDHRLTHVGVGVLEGLEEWREHLGRHRRGGGPGQSTRRKEKEEGQ